MIFIAKEEKGENYEVRVYKAKPEDNYVPHKSDKILKVYETDEYASFIFESFDNAIEFVVFIPVLHTEYHERPVRETTNKI